MPKLWERSLSQELFLCRMLKRYHIRNSACKYLESPCFLKRCKPLSVYLRSDESVKMRRGGISICCTTYAYPKQKH